jgi:hypothetical protein
MFAAGCGKGDKAEQAQKVVDDFSLEQAREGLAEIKATLERGESVDIACAASESYASDLTSEEGKKIAADLNQICGFDAPVAVARAALAAAEKARADKGEEEVLSECFSAEWNMALSTLKEKFADKPVIAELEGKWTAVCPPRK